MIASHITPEIIHAAAAKIGVAVEVKPLNREGTRLRVKVNAVKPNPYPRVSSSGRKVHAVCWHGFRDFFRACYAEAPAAVFATGVSTYKGSAGFERDFPGTGHTNIGSQMNPLAYCDACDCPDCGRAS